MDVNNYFVQSIPRSASNMNLLIILFISLFTSSNGFHYYIKKSSVFSRTNLIVEAVNNNHGVMNKIRKVMKSKPEAEEEFEKMITGMFPGAVSNNDLESKVVRALMGKGFTSDNTLLGTSLCSDELARQLEDDFVKVYGNNFNLGGLSGFPFAGNTGFGAMAAHIPDGGNCLIVYGPHVGVSADGVVGKVERSGIALVDNCCGSAIAASNYLAGITDGDADVSIDIQSFTDFQQNAVQKLILPHGKRLAEAKNRMAELPYALYDSQDLLMRSIVAAGVGDSKKGMALLGGIQINTGPDTLDYFHPLRFDYMNNEGVIVEDMLPKIKALKIYQVGGRFQL